MAFLGNVNQLFKDLKTEFSKSKPDLKKCGTLLESLKVNKRNYFVTNFTQFSLISDKLVEDLLHAD
jgi:hypothetical protein